MVALCVLRTICHVSLMVLVVKEYFIIRRYKVIIIDIQYNIDSFCHKLTLTLHSTYHSCYYCRESTHMISKSFYRFARGDEKNDC